MIDGRTPWVALSAPAVGHPGGRHDVARLWLASVGADGWRDHGPLFPEDGSPGSREWAGCTVLAEDGTVTVFYTAAGTRGEERRSFRQRIIAATGRLSADAGSLSVSGWGEHREVLEADGALYQPADQLDGAPGFIKAFRDPFFFVDPATEQSYLLFTESLAGATTEFNGAIGVAAGNGSENWELLPPLLVADGVNNELERPHVVFRDGYYYLFFSTQRRTFHPETTGPSGLYGFVSSSFGGPYEPINDSGLVLQNPVEEPYQAYSWLVLDDLTVVSFADTVDLGGRPPEDLEEEGGDAVRRHFGGTLAPGLRLSLSSRRAVLVVADATAP